MLTYFENAWESRHIIISFVKHDLNARYRGSFMGMLWAILTPLGMTLIIATVYSMLWKSDIHYFVPYLFSGLTPWTYLLSCGDMGAGAYIGAEGYIKQLPIKMEIFPIRCNTVAFINNLLFGLLAYFLTLVILSPSMLTIWTLMLIPALLLLYIFGMAFSTIAGIAQVYIRDYAPMQSLVMQALFYVTPILYDYKMLEEMGCGFVYQINPVFYLIQITRDALMGVQADPALWGMAVAIVVVVFMLSQILFARTKNKIVFRL